MFIHGRGASERIGMIETSH